MRNEKLPEPIRFGKYQLLERVAAGRMGEVFKAKSTGVEGFEKILAIKLINKQFSKYPNFVQTF